MNPNEVSMIKHLCQNCIYKVEPTSIKDYFLKSLSMPKLKHWGDKEFKHLFWLCSNPDVSKVDHTEEHIIHKPCVEYNFNGNCTFFRSPDAEDIIPSLIEMKILKDNEPTTEETFFVNEDVFLEITMKPFETETITEEREVEKQKTDIDGLPLFDEEGNPVMGTVTETVIIEPSVKNDQNISYSYIWYKNGRKLFQRKSNTFKINTSSASTDEYYCVVVQAIENNGDGGNKVVETKSDTITVIIEELPEEVPEKPSEELPEIPTEDTSIENTSTEEGNS